MKKKHTMSKQWACNYISSAVIELMTISLCLSELINNEKIKRSNIYLGRQADNIPHLSPQELKTLIQVNNKLDKVIYGYLSDVQNEYFKQ